MPVGKGVNMRTLIEKKIQVEGIEAVMTLNMERGTIEIKRIGTSTPDVTNVLAFVLGDRDVKRMMSHVPVKRDVKIKLVSFKGTYFVMKGGKRLLTTGKGFYFGSMPELKTGELYELVQFLRKCGLDIRAGKCNAGYRFI